MLCYLESVRIVERTNTDRPPVLSCTWLGKSGDETAEKTKRTAKGMLLNRKAALARTTTITKGIFPLDKTDLAMWLKTLMPNTWIDSDRDKIDNIDDFLSENDYVLSGDDPKGYMLTPEKDENPTLAGIVYESIPVNKLDSKLTYVNYLNTAGKVVKLTAITSVGYSVVDDDGNEVLDENKKPVWDTDGQQSAYDMALSNLENGLASGTYWVEDEDEQTETEPEKEPEKQETEPEKAIKEPEKVVRGRRR